MFCGCVVIIHRKHAMRLLVWALTVALTVGTAGGVSRRPLMASMTAYDWSSMPTRLGFGSTKLSARLHEAKMG